MNTVILAEKPSQAKAYSEAFDVETREKTHITLKSCSTFPSGAIITWGIGHLVSLKMPGEYKEEWKKWDLKNLPIIPERFEFKVTKDTQMQFNAVKKLFKQADVIINGCDAEREGSNIFYSILNMTGANNKTIKRLWINSLESDEVLKGFNNLLDNEKDLMLYNEAKTRQISDWLVGVNASQLYTLLVQQKGLDTTLSVGRVQSPSVYLIYQRQKEIKNFVSRPFYEIVGSFKTTSGLSYTGKAKIKEDNKDVIHQVLKEYDLDTLKNRAANIISVERLLKKTKIPRLHSLSTLQSKMNKLYKYSPAKVLQIMQNLYEKKLVSYPRTDSNFITDKEFSYLSNNVEEYQSMLGISFVPNKVLNKRFVDNEKVQGHYAIILTRKVPTVDEIKELSYEEQNIYQEISLSTLSIFHNDYEYEETNVITNVNGIEFFTKGKTEKNKGWKELFENEEKKTKDITLPILQNNENVIGDLEVTEGFTTPPKPYTEGDLINMMKTAGKVVEDEAESAILKEIEGIGTEATRAGIIETIKRNKYIEVEKNIVHITPKGIMLCETIEGSLLSSPAMTAKWESYLKKIGEGKGTQESFLKNIEKFLTATIESASQKISSNKIIDIVKSQQENNYIGNCPVCQGGQITEQKTFYGCSNYRNGCSCTFTLPKKWCEKTITIPQVKKLLTQGKTDKIKGFKSKKGSTFEATLTIVDGKMTAQFS